jgi:plastocyanin
MNLLAPPSCPERAPAPGAAPAPGLAFAACAPLAMILALAGALAVPPLAAEELTGRLVFLAKDGKSPARGVDPRQAVVYFEPAETAHAGRSPKEPDKPFQLLTKKKEFFPHVLPVPVGSIVQFPNQDPILHNVFSVSPGNAFDLGIYRTGPPKEKRFDQPGVVRVYCNVHQAMVAYILVLDTSHYASPDVDGSFRLTGLPKGPGKLTVWHEQADPWSQELRLPMPPAQPSAQPAGSAASAKPAPSANNAPQVQPRLVVARPKLTPHLNKTGGSYSSGDDYR